LGKRLIFMAAYEIEPVSLCAMATEEEKAKAAKNTSSEGGGNVPKASESAAKLSFEEGTDSKREIQELEREILDLKITNRGKDYFIEQLQSEREGLLSQVVQSSRKG
jgi:hypothetical protein